MPATIHPLPDNSPSRHVRTTEEIQEFRADCERAAAAGRAAGRRARKFEKDYRLALAAANTPPDARPGLSLVTDESAARILEASQP